MFGSMMGDFDEDMFMNNPMNMMQMQMRNMNRMMNSLMPDPFNMLMPFDQGHNNSLMERNNGPAGMGGLFGFPMPNMNRLLNADIGGANGSSFCSSSVISMSSGPDGRPQIYQATSSSKTGPGGIRETRKTVQDSTTGLKKMAIGHHIGDRAHIIEKEQDLRSGQLEEHQEFINLDEEEAEDFDREFTTKARHGRHVLQTGPRSHEILAIEDVDDADGHGRHRRQMPALPPASSAISKRSTTTTPATQNVTTSSTSVPNYGRGYELHDNNNYASRRMPAHRNPSLGIHARRSLRTPISSPLAMSPAGSHHHAHHYHHAATASPSATQTHPYKNTRPARRHQRARQNTVPQQQQQSQQVVEEIIDDNEPKKKQEKIYKPVVEERNADDSLVIIEEPDDSEEEKDVAKK